MKYLILLATILTFNFSHGQRSLTELYNARDFEAMAAYELESGNMDSLELYMLGYAFFQLGSDEKAIHFYDKSIEKGFQDATVYFYKGLSLRFMEKYDKALKEIDKAIELDPSKQEFLNERGVIFYMQEKYDKALEVFEAAILLPSADYPEPYYWIAAIYHDKGEYQTALAKYYRAIEKLTPDNSYYLQSLVSVGQLEYVYTHDYTKSVNAYEQAVALQPDNYALYYKLIKSYNAAQSFKKANALFEEVKTAFKAGKLPKEDMEMKSVAIAEFDWQGQKAVIRRSLTDIEEALDISYKVFLLNKQGDEVVRRFVVEKTLKFSKKSPGHLLCEQVKADGSHITYLYGWMEESDITVTDLQEAVTRILDGKLKPGASSSFGGNE